MYFVCTIQPKLSDEEEGNYIGPWLTQKEKRQAIDLFYAKKQHIPLSIDHTAAGVFGAAVPGEKQVGRVLDLFIDRHGYLMAKCKLSKKSDSACERIIRSMCVEKTKWGVSPRIDWSMPGGLEGPIDKQLTHIAFTLTPFLADFKTYIHHWAFKQPAIDRIIQEQHYTAEESGGLAYAAPSFVERLEAKKLNKGVFLFYPNQRSLPLPNTTVAQEQERMDVETTPNTPAQQQVLGTEKSASQEQAQQRESPTPSNDKPFAQRQEQKLTGRLGELEERVAKLRGERQVAKCEFEEMPSMWQQTYLESMKELNEYRKELSNHVTGLMKSGLLPGEMGETYQIALGDNTNSPGRPMICGFVQASFEDHRKRATEYGLIFEEKKKLELSKKSIEDERNNYLSELEGMKKKIKTQESAPTMPAFAGIAMGVESGPAASDIKHDLLRLDGERKEIGRRHVDQHLKATFNHQAYVLNTDAVGLTNYQILQGYTNQLLQ